MTIPERNEQLTQMIGDFVAMVRRLVAQDGPVDDKVDRVLAAATVAFGAIALGWPRGKKLPGVLASMIAFGRHLWARRSWWTS